MQLNTSIIKNILDAALKEDLGINGDITSNAVILRDTKVKFTISARQNIILCGVNIAAYFFDNYSSIRYKLHSSDAKPIMKGGVIISGYGLAHEILLLERVILNYLQMLSGISTLTNLFVTEVSGSKAKVCDTRKTIPNLRILQKYAVRCGGGNNHRGALDSSILIKDNHISICGNITEAISKAKLATPHYAKIEVECDLISQVKEAVQEGADVIMLDNMSLSQVKAAVKIIDSKALIEVSGGISLKNVKKYASCGVDIISVGRLTHSAPAVDIGLDI